MQTAFGNVSLDWSAWQPTIEEIAPGISDHAATVAADSDNWITSISRAMSGLVMADSQRRILNVQLDRAKNGLPPLDASQYGLGVNVGLSPTTLNALLLGAGAIALLFVVNRRGR